MSSAETQNRSDPRSLILAALVCISLFLTARIWFGMPSGATAYEPFSPRRQEPTDAGLAALIVPSHIMLHSGDDVHTGLLASTADYATLWDKGQLLRNSLMLMGSLRRDAPTYAEVHQARTDGFSVELIFTDGYRLSDLADIHEGVGEYPDLTVDRLIVSLGKTPMVYARVYPSLQYVAWSVKPDAMDAILPSRQFKPQKPVRYLALQEQIGEMHMASGTYVPQTPPLMALLGVQREPSGASAVLSTFFVDTSMLRKIEERDGALIYSDGRRGVRVYPSGAMDYGQPEPGGVEVSKMQAIEKAVLYGLEHGGLPGTAYLDRTVPVSTATHQGTRVKINFRYEGVPIVGSRGIIEVFVSSKGPEEFLRNLRTPTGDSGSPEPVITAREAINAISDNRRAIFGDQNPGYVISVELAYMNSSPEDQIEPLRPVWMVDTTMGWSIFVDAITGIVARRSTP